MMPGHPYLPIPVHRCGIERPKQTFYVSGSTGTSVFLYTLIAVAARAYTRSLGRQSGSGSVGGQLLYTARAGYVTVIRDISMFATGTGTLQGNLYYSTGSLQIHLMRDPILFDHIYHLELRQVLPVGANLMFGIAADFWSVAVTGYELLDG